MRRNVRRRVTLMGAVAASAVGAFPASAFAVSASMTAPTGPVPEDIATQITVAGDAGAGLRLYVRSRVSGAAPCAPVFKNDTGDVLVNSSVSAAFTETTSVTYSSPGTNQICIWLQTASDANSAAFATTATLVVRQPNTTFSLAPPSRVRSGQPTQLTVSYQAEIERRVYVRLKPAGGSGCAPNVKNDTGEYVISGTTVDGGPSTTTATFDAGAPGTYLLCGWVQESSDEEIAEVTTQATFTVPRISTKTGLGVKRYYGYPKGYAVAGRVVGGVSGGTVTLQRLADGQWRKWKTATIGSGGYYSVVIYPKSRALIRVRYPGNGTYLPSTSKEQPVRRFR